MENLTLQVDSFMVETEAAQRKEKLINTYNLYQKIDWGIFIVLMGVPIVFALLQGLGLPGMNVEELMYFIANLPFVVMALVAIASAAYTVWSIWLYVKVWPIKEIPKGSTYWFDWVLTIVLIVYDTFIFYVLLFR